MIASILSNFAGSRTPNKSMVGHACVATILLVLPLWSSDFVLGQIAAYAAILGLLALSLTILGGYGGMVSLAQVSFAGAAGYAVAILGTNASGIHGFGWPLWLVLPCAIGLSTTFAAAVGWMSIRTEGIYTIMITLATAMAAFYLCQQDYTLFNGHSGFSGLPKPAVLGLDLNDPALFYYLCAAVGAVGYAAVLYGERSHFGLALQAIRDNPRRMRALGFNVTAHKLVAWAISGSLAGVAGVLLAWHNGRISPATIGVDAAIEILVIAVIGGLRHPAGAFLGALLVVLIQTFAVDLVGRDHFNALIGAVFLVVIYTSPDGLLGYRDAIRKALRRSMPAVFHALGSMASKGRNV
ncbi:branched-chain amino acid ABC transporter permease [Mesorhizobium australicum]|uniref:branched-chain amino acid ABC transporter permease n=1 Tax=Mesorhizobium australicum TaxID=536018 RepID=UPI00333623AB